MYFIVEWIHKKNFICIICDPFVPNKGTRVHMWVKISSTWNFRRGLIYVTPSYSPHRWNLMRMLFPSIVVTNDHSVIKTLGFYILNSCIKFILEILIYTWARVNYDFISIIIYVNGVQSLSSISICNHVTNSLLFLRWNIGPFMVSIKCITPKILLLHIFWSHTLFHVHGTHFQGLLFVFLHNNLHGELSVSSFDLTHWYSSTTIHPIFLKDIYVWIIF